MLNHEACYAALRRRDPRYDGIFFVAVRTTGIYCRPICPARTPLSCNVTFYSSAAQAHAANYWPCLRCRPESAPDSPAWLGTMASVNRALRLIEEGALAQTSAERLAAKLGMTGRHLRRLFAQHLGVGLTAVEATRRINLAKKLVHETNLPMTQIAYAAGFRSLRRFNEAFHELFARPPTAIRREPGGRRRPEAGAPIRLRLAYRPPFEWSRRLAEMAAAVLPDGEAIEGPSYRTSFEIDGRTASVMVSQGRGRTLAIELENVPVRHLARVLVETKRRLLLSSAAEPVFSEAA